MDKVNGQLICLNLQKLQDEFGDNSKILETEQFQNTFEAATQMCLMKQLFRKIYSKFEADFSNSR